MSHFALTVDTAPAVEPITLDEAKKNSRVDLDDEDARIEDAIKAAREHAEDLMGRQLITATLELSLDGFHAVIAVPRPPLQSVNSLKYYDINGVLQTLVEDTDFLVDAASFVGRIVPYPGTAWPIAQARPGAVIVNYDAGYGDAASDVPAKIKQAIYLLTSHFYEHREPVVVGVSVAELPLAVESLLRPLAVPQV